MWYDCIGRPANQLFGIENDGHCNYSFYFLFSSLSFRLLVFQLIPNVVEVNECFGLCKINWL